MPQTQDQKATLRDLVSRVVAAGKAAGKSAEEIEKDAAAVIQRFGEQNSAPPGLEGIGMDFPKPTPGALQGVGGDVGKVIEFLSGFTPFRPIPAAIGMGSSAIGEFMQGGDAEDAAVSAGMTGTTSALGRLLSQTFTALGLKMGGHHDDAWKTAGDFYNLRPTGPTAIGQTGKIQREVDRSGDALAGAMEGKKVSLRPIVGAADDAIEKSPKARGTYRHDFKMGAWEEEREILRQQLVDAGWSKNAVYRMSDDMLAKFAEITEVPLADFGAIKQVAEETGRGVRQAGQQHQRVVRGAADAEGEVNSAVAARTRATQHEDPKVSAALDRNARAQRVKQANADTQHRSSLPYLLNNGSGMLTAALRSSVGRPAVISTEGKTLDYIVRALLSGAKLPQGGGQ